MCVTVSGVAVNVCVSRSFVEDRESMSIESISSARTRTLQPKYNFNKSTNLQQPTLSISMLLRLLLHELKTDP